MMYTMIRIPSMLLAIGIGSLVFQVILLRRISPPKNDFMAMTKLGLTSRTFPQENARNASDSKYSLSITDVRFGSFSDDHKADKTKEGSMMNAQMAKKSKDGSINDANKINKTKMAMVRLFPHEHFTNATDLIHTHYMDPWGFDVVSYYKSDFSAQDVISDSITLVSQVTVDDARVQRILDLTSRWSGYISMTLYFAPNAPGHKVSSMEQAMHIVDDIRAKYAKELRNVHFHLVFNSHRDIPYPQNFLRNVAINNVVTDFLMLLDADLIPPPGSHDILLETFKTTPELMNDEKTLLILPAFERRLMGTESVTSVTADDLPTTKAALLKQIKENPDMLVQFHLATLEADQSATNYKRWYGAKKPYLADEYHMYYEPYYVIRKIPALPPCWEHFTGFGKDKVTWVEETAAAGFKFYVSPDMFLIHINHDYSGQEVRFERPFITNEYINQYQPYLRRVHGKSFWTDHELFDMLRICTQIYIRSMNFRICRDRSISFGGSRNLNLHYFCWGGERYERFSTEMQLLAAQLPEPMGRRAFPMASDSTILVLGNSHTRQVITTLVCQFKDEVVEYKHALGRRHARRVGDSFKVRFRNNSTLVSLIDIPVVYSSRWVSVVEKLVGRPLASLDGIVLGKIDYFKRDSMGASVNETVMAVTGGTSMAGKASSRTIQDILSAFDGPVVFVSSFGLRGRWELEETYQIMNAIAKNGTRPDNFSVIDGRKYIDTMTLECGMEDVNSDLKGMCLENTISIASGGRQADSMHRCIGPEGGHPDLIAWELAERLNNL